MDFQQGKNILEEKKLFTSASELSSSWKKTRSHNFSYETFPHYLAKACLIFLICRKNKRFNTVGALSEYEFPNARCIDVLQIIGKEKEIVGYEVETSSDNHKKTPDKLPIITIDLRKAPDKVKEAFKILESYFKDFIV
jgi:hypothetical protein